MGIHGNSGHPLAYMPVKEEEKKKKKKIKV